MILVLYYYISDKPIVSLIHQYTNIFSLKIPPDNYEEIIKFYIKNFCISRIICSFASSYNKTKRKLTKDWCTNIHY